MEKIQYEHPTGLALSLTAGIVYVICTAAIALWPVGSLKFMSAWFHGIDLMKIATPFSISLGAVVLGLVEVLIVAYLIGVLYAWLYNKCVAHCKKKDWL